MQKWHPMPNNSDEPRTLPDMEAVNERLKQIVDSVSDESLPLEDALSLYEEAVGLGMKASELIESDILQRNEVDSENAEE